MLPMQTKQIRTWQSLDMTERRYKSKVDWWLGVLLVVPPAGAIVTMTTSNVMLGLLPLALITAIYGGLVFPTRYGLCADELVVRFGLVRVRIPYREITNVDRTRSVLSSPALSLDRLRIEWRGKAIMISPREREDFLRELAVRRQQSGPSSPVDSSPVQYR
jgi:Bacterial PH domain